MDGIKLNALCVKAVDYKDNKTLLTLCTIEKGKIGAAIRGVKSEKSKLRFAASLLCFGEYILSERGGYYTVTGCTLVDGFYDARADVERLYAALSVTEILDRTTEEGADISESVYSALDALKNIAYGKNPARALLEYLVRASAENGYAIDLKTCAGCGEEALRGWFDASTGGGVCASCRSRRSTEMSGEAFDLLYNIIYNKNRGIEPRKNDALKTENGEVLNVEKESVNTRKDALKVEDREVLASERGGDESKKDDISSGEKEDRVRSDAERECLSVVYSYFSACNEVRINALSQLLALKFLK
jgi:DNA repair protein RecO (recombination protein O)